MPRIHDEFLMSFITSESYTVEIRGEVLEATRQVNVLLMHAETFPRESRLLLVDAFLQNHPINITTGLAASPRREIMTMNIPRLIFVQ